MLTDIITADKDKKNIFDKEYIEVLLPVNDEGFKLLEAKCPDALYQIHKCLDDESVKTAWIDLKVSFDFQLMETHFYIITNCIYADGKAETWVENDITGDFEFDGNTAEYIKNKAIKEFLNSMEVMACCVNNFEE